MSNAGLWVAILLVSDRTAEKISALHGIDPLDVHDEIVCRTGLPYEWDDDRDRGLRAIVRITIGRVPCFVVLYPAGDDIYHLGSAYPESS